MPGFKVRDHEFAGDGLNIKMRAGVRLKFYHISSYAL